MTYAGLLLTILCVIAFYGFMWVLAFLGKELAREPFTCKEVHLQALWDCAIVLAMGGTIVAFGLAYHYISQFDFWSQKI